jgi:hypothetical protein
VAGRIFENEKPVPPPLAQDRPCHLVERHHVVQLLFGGENTSPRSQ